MFLMTNLLYYFMSAVWWESLFSLYKWHISKLSMPLNKKKEKEIIVKQIQKLTDYE